MTRISSAYSPAAEREEPAPLPRGRRRTELLMLIFAVAVVLLAYASVGYGLNGKPPKGLLVYGLSFAALVFAAHLAVRRLAPWADPLLLPLAALLNGLGIVMIYRLQESGRDGNPGNVIATMSAGATAYQVIYSAVGLAVFVAVLGGLRQPRVLQRYTYTLGAIGLVLLAIPALLPASMSSVNGAKVWIIVGGFSIQPADPGLRDRHRHVRAVFRLVRRDDLHCHPAHLLAADRDPAVPLRQLRRQQALRPRRRALRHLAAPVRWPEPHPQRLPAGAGPRGHGLRRHPRHRARPRPAVLHAAGAK